MKIRNEKLNGDAMTSNDIICLCPESRKESDFLKYFANLVKQEMMNEITKRMQNLAFFEHVNINL